MSMAIEELISIDEFCAGHNITISFISNLQQNGLIQTTIVEQRTFIPANQLPTLEKIVRLHYDLEINLEGIETINHLLQRVEAMRSEIISLQNRLRRYEA